MYSISMYRIDSTWFNLFDRWCGKKSDAPLAARQWWMVMWWKKNQLYRPKQILYLTPILSTFLIKLLVLAYWTKFSINIFVLKLIIPLAYNQPLLPCKTRYLSYLGTILMAWHHCLTPIAMCHVRCEMWEVRWSWILMKCSWFASAAAGDSVAATADLPNVSSEPAEMKNCQSIRQGGGLYLFSQIQNRRRVAQ